MKFLRVVVANELRSYREAIARAMQSVRPDVEVSEAEPEELNREVNRLQPDLVICSRVTSLVETCVPVWVELYPNHVARSNASIRGESMSVEDMQFTDLLTLLDQMQSSVTPD